MARVHLYVHGRGRGHATRSAAVAETLRAAGHSVRVFAGDDAAAFFSDDPDSERVDSVRPGQALGGVPKAVRRVAQSVRTSAGDRPDVVISDGDLPGAVAARLRGIPCVAIGHGLVFGFCERPAGVPEAPWKREGAKSRRAAAGSRVQVAVSFVPLEPLAQSTVVARPSVELDTAPPAHDDPLPLLAYFRDPARAREALSAVVGAGVEPLVFASEDPGVGGTTWHPLDRAGFQRALGSAQRVLSSAGSQLISECLARGVPQFALFAERDDEQRLNVALLRAAGLPGGCSFERAPTSSELLSFVGSPRSPAEPVPDLWAETPAPTVSEAALAAVERLAQG